ncbi:hypothetical protein [Microbaculum sp. FT89]|uniref:hypothetical protein n=1 Tax=Microbaculum sp. FT89 TaxID=3447298 RepID=UPI003F53E2AC
MASMNAVYLSPDALGTLNALRALGDITHFEESAGDELVAAGLAERYDRKLTLTRLGQVAVVRMRIDSPRLPQSPRCASGPQDFGRLEDFRLPAGDANGAEISISL